MSRIEDLPPGCDGDNHCWDTTEPPEPGAPCICGQTRLPEGRWVDATPELLDGLYAEAWLGQPGEERP